MVKQSTSIKRMKCLYASGSTTLSRILCSVKTKGVRQRVFATIYLKTICILLYALNISGKVCLSLWR